MFINEVKGKVNVMIVDSNRTDGSFAIVFGSKIAPRQINLKSLNFQDQAKELQDIVDVHEINQCFFYTDGLGIGLYDEFRRLNELNERIESFFSMNNNSEEFFVNKVLDKLQQIKNR